MVMMMMTTVVPGTVQSTSHELPNVINTTEETDIINIPIVQKRKFKILSLLKVTLL